MIPDNILEECLDKVDMTIMNTYKKNENKNFDEIKLQLSKDYDKLLFDCLSGKNVVHMLKPENKSDLTTTKIELRKAECLNKY